MEFGVGYFPTHDGIGPGEVAALVEAYGFESLFFAEHSHTPASRESPYPGGGPMPAKYHHSYDLFVALTAAAAATRRLRVGSGICLVAQRDPIHTAKETASLDRLSGGRFEFGVGAGWNREEMANHGTNPKTRMRLFTERVAAIKEIWTHDEASFHGEFVDFEAIWQWPKPAQTPHPPVLVGGDGPTVGDRVAAVGDAWIPNYFPEAFDRFAEMRAAIDRPVELQFLGAPRKPEVITRSADFGVSRYAVWAPSGPRGVVEAALEKYGRAIAEFNGEI